MKLLGSILSETSISSAVELYNSMRIICNRIPSASAPVDYLRDLPQNIEFQSMVSLNKRCTAFLGLE